MATTSVAASTPRPPPPSDLADSPAVAAGSRPPTGRKAEPRTGAAPAAPAAPGAGTPSAAGKPGLQRPRKKVNTSPYAPAPKPPAQATPGYAAPAATTATTSAAASTTTSSGDWAFLSDKGLSIEEKLARFAAAAMARTDRDLEAKMARYKADYAEAKAASAAAEKKGGSSLFGILESVVPGLSELTKLFGESAFKKAATSMGGPVLAAAATAAGFPELAPLALKFGGDLVGLAFSPLGGSSRAAGTSTAGDKKEAGTPDEKMAMLEIQLLVEKQQRMFTAISNALRSLHDTQMAAVHNLR